MQGVDIFEWIRVLPIVVAPMEIAGCAVLEVDPVQQAGFDEGLFYKAVGVVALWVHTGVEPDFALVKFKKLAGGGYFKIVNDAVPVALKHLGYSTEEIDLVNAIEPPWMRAAKELDHLKTQIMVYTSII